MLEGIDFKAKKMAKEECRPARDEPVAMLVAQQQAFPLSAVNRENSMPIPVQTDASRIALELLDDEKAYSRKEAFQKPSKESKIITKAKRLFLKTKRVDGDYFDYEV